MNWLTNILHWRPIGRRWNPADNVRVLAVMAKDSDGQALYKIAGKWNWNLEFASTYEAAMRLVKRREFAVILCDRDLTLAFDWREALRTITATAPRSRVILTSRVNDDHLWQEVIERGGYDVLTKPFLEDRVVRSVEFAFRDQLN